MARNRHLRPLTARTYMSVMAEPALYSRVVRILKVALPLAALGILSVLFIVAEQLDPEAAIPYADVDVEQILRDQGITNPTFGGVTDEGDVISLGAESLKRLPGGDQMVAALMTGALEFASGRRVDIDAPAGEFDAETNMMALTGGVTLTDTQGVVVMTDEVALNLTDLTGRTGAIEAESPDARLAAGSMELRRSAAGNILVFDGGVRLLFYPDPSRKDDHQ